MDSPRDVNSSEMRSVYGNRLSIDNPLLGDNPKVAALRKEQSDKSMKVLIDEALKKFFFPEPAFDPEPAPEIEPPKKKPNSDAGVSMLVSLFKMLVETVFNNKVPKE